MCPGKPGKASTCGKSHSLPHVSGWQGQGLGPYNLGRGGGWVLVLHPEACWKFVPLLQHLFFDVSPPLQSPALSPLGHPPPQLPPTFNPVGGSLIPSDAHFMCSFAHSGLFLCGHAVRGVLPALRVLQQADTLPPCPHAAGGPTGHRHTLPTNNHVSADNKKAQEGGLDPRLCRSGFI